MWWTDLIISNGTEGEDMSLSLISLLKISGMKLGFCNDATKNILNTTGKSIQTQK